jgi:hypothetical protein
VNIDVVLDVRAVTQPDRAVHVRIQDVANRVRALAAIVGKAIA